MIAEPTGTDGFRLLCHQFSTSSLPRRANCISKYKTCSLTVKPMTPALPRLLASGDQGQNTRNAEARWFRQLHRSGAHWSCSSDTR